MARGQREKRVSFAFLLSLPDFTSALGSKKCVLIVVDQEGTRPMKRKRPLTCTPPDNGPIGSNEACTVGEGDLAPISTPRSHAKFRNALGVLIIYPFILCLPIF